MTTTLAASLAEWDARYADLPERPPLGSRPDPDAG